MTALTEAVRRRHYHANHVDAPARGSQRAAVKDARRMGVPVGPMYPSIVVCYRVECVVAADRLENRTT